MPCCARGHALGQGTRHRAVWSSSASLMRVPVSQRFICPSGHRDGAAGLKVRHRTVRRPPTVSTSLIRLEHLLTLDRQVHDDPRERRNGIPRMRETSGPAGNRSPAGPRWWLARTKKRTPSPYGTMSVLSERCVSSASASLANTSPISSSEYRSELRRMTSRSNTPRWTARYASRAFSTERSLV